MQHEACYTSCLDTRMHTRLQIKQHAAPSQLRLCRRQAFQIKVHHSLILRSDFEQRRTALRKLWVFPRFHVVRYAGPEELSICQFVLTYSEEDVQRK